MGKGRGDEDDEVEVEGVDDAFGEAHQSDDEEYDANAIEEETDDDEGGNVMSPEKIRLAKEEKKRRREQKKAQRAALEKTREEQNAAIAKVRGFLPNNTPITCPTRCLVSRSQLRAE